jgi:sarcosine oxidase delta subunit
MSLCPYCHQREKEFFADKCDSCNTRVSFGDQVAASVTYVLTYAITIVGGIAIFVALFG